MMNIPANLDMRVNEAISYFWSKRDTQTERQHNSNIQDNGNRAAVTGGKQLDGFVKLTRDILCENGLPTESIYVNSALELPGYYRPNKKWDLLVVDNHELVAAIEFKSHVGPSFGNNFNNRTEEAMGSALDIWTAYREGVFGTQKAPWLGYFMLLEDCAASNSPVKIHSPHFDVLSEFVDASYKERYEIFCSKLVLERKYNASCLITTRKPENGVSEANYPRENLSYHSFITSMLGAIIAHVNERR